jgi:uncharacterized protein (TIGR00269 family)
LCREHFIADLEAKAKREIRLHRGIRGGDRIAVALSGDAPGSALLFFLKKLTAQRRDVKVFAIIIDEGIASYRNPGQVVQVAESMGADIIPGSFREAYSITMDEIMQRVGAEVAYRNYRVLRRQLLARIAQENGATCLASAITLDDRAQAVLCDMLTGNVETLIVPRQHYQGALKDIYPFMQVPEQEVRLYAELNAIPCVKTSPYPFTGSEKRADINRMLEAYDRNHPATRFALGNLGEQLAAAGTGAIAGIAVCARCGEPCPDGTCPDCQIRDGFSKGSQP